MKELKELKPAGLNEAVSAKVLQSVSRKRTHSGDSDETLDAGEAPSKDTSVEASEAGLVEKVPKKGKKAKVVKTGNEDEASKPSESGGDV